MPSGLEIWGVSDAFSLVLETIESSKRTIKQLDEKREEERGREREKKRESEKKKERTEEREP